MGILSSTAIAKQDVNSRLAVKYASSIPNCGVEPQECWYSYDCGVDLGVLSFRVYARKAQMPFGVRYEIPYPCEKWSRTQLGVEAEMPRATVVQS